MASLSRISMNIELRTFMLLELANPMDRVCRFMTIRMPQMRFLRVLVFTYPRNVCLTLATTCQEVGCVSLILIVDYAYCLTVHLILQDYPGRTYLAFAM